MELSIEAQPSIAAALGKAESQRYLMSVRVRMPGLGLGI